MAVNCSARSFIINKLYALVVVHRRRCRVPCERIRISIFPIPKPPMPDRSPGRVYIMISRATDREPRLQVGRVGVPFFGRDIEKLAPGQAAVIDATDLGSPVVSLSEIPAGEYQVQAFINIYSEFKRADGHTVWMHDDKWEGQHWNRSPGNLYSVVKKITLDAKQGYRIALSCDQVIPPIPFPADTEWVKRFRIQSPLLTKFWGRPIYLGATILLPRDYAKTNEAYPVLYSQGHFSTAPPMNFQPGREFANDWMKDNFPRMLVVTFQHPAPYFDDSYAVNSVNLGPYGDAIYAGTDPGIEKRFRVIRQPWARLLAGGSTGGWESDGARTVSSRFFRRHLGLLSGLHGFFGRRRR